ncbi:hypothetical protein [Sphingomonas agri]|uniref:hypothetical protein n=1 Tax=Sphingomonas agri TaxID=1813878 RepID=UPI00311F5F03
MSRVLKVAAVVVGVAALAATGIGLAIGTAATAFTIGGTAVSIGALATALSAGAALISLAAGVMAKPPKLKSAGQQLDWAADPATGEPYVMGNAMVGASIVHQASWGDKNRYLGIVGVLSLGTIAAYNGFYADMTPVTFSGRNATGYYANYLYLSDQLGAQPESAALTMTAPDASTMPDWGSAFKTSGLATVGLVLVADIDNGKVYSGGTPKMTNLVQGVKAYDMRFDSTVSGGSGSQRALTESTYAYSENPWVHAVTYAIGRWQNGVRVLGPGLPVSKIDLAAFMEAAAVADSNGWKISGMIASTDPKWEALKAICQAGGGYPMPTGAHLSCLVNTPKISLATITEADVKGAVSAPQMFTRRQRLNGAIPRIRSANHGWEIVPQVAVRNSTYLTADGGNAATREFEFALIADKGDGAGFNQGAQIAAYEVANTRELSPISVELGYVWSQYKLGDCLTLNLPSANLASRKCVVIGRTLNPARNTVTLIFRTEDDAKHAWALGLTGSVSVAPTTTQAHGVGDQNTVHPGANIAALGDSNRARFSLYEKGTLGWTYYNPNSLTLTDWGTSDDANGHRLKAQGTFTASGQQFALISDSYISGNKNFRYPVTPGERVFVSLLLDIFGGWDYEVKVSWRADDDTEITFDSVETGTGPILITDDHRCRKFLTVPGGTRYAAFQAFAKQGGHGTGTFAIGMRKPMLCGAALNQVEEPAFTPGPSSEYGADVSYWVEGTPTWTFEYDYTGAALPGEFSRDFGYSLKTTAGFVSSGVSWTYLVQDGTANGKTVVDGEQSMSGSGAGTLTISSLSVSAATVKVMARIGGVLRGTFTLKLNQHLNAAPVGGSTTGSGGTMPISKSSGWTPIASGSFASVSGPMSGTMPAGKTTANAGGTLYARPGSGALPGDGWNIEAKLQRNTGTSGSPIWTDVGSVVTGTSSVEADPETGHVYRNPATLDFNINDTGRTAGSTYDWQIVGRINGTGSTNTTQSHAISGTITIAAP